MKGLSLSGGSTKIAAIAGVVITLGKEYNYKPDIITGVSAGSIIAVPLAMGLFDEIEEYTTGFDLDDIFSISPVNKKGKISFRGILRAIMGKQSFGAQDKLKDTLSEIITYEKFNEYINGDYAPCYLGCVEFKTGKRVYINVKEVTYNEYLMWVNASSSIPVFVESVKVGEEYYYDGGVRDHIGSNWVMDNFDLTDHVSIYSRPKDYNITDENWKPGNIMNVLIRTTAIMNTEISKNDEFKEDELALHKGINNKKIFMPHILNKSTYEVSPKLLKEWYQLGVEAARNQFR